MAKFWQANKNEKKKSCTIQINKRKMVRLLRANRIFWDFNILRHL